MNLFTFYKFFSILFVWNRHTSWTVRQRSWQPLRPLIVHNGKSGFKFRCHLLRGKYRLYAFSGHELQVKIFWCWFISDQLRLTRPHFLHNCLISADAFSARPFTVMLAASVIKLLSICFNTIKSLVFSLKSPRCLLKIVLITGYKRFFGIMIAAQPANSKGIFSEWKKILRKYPSLIHRKSG